MNNKEFYQKWGRSSTLKYLVNSIIVLGMSTVTDSVYTHTLKVDYTNWVNIEDDDDTIPGPLDLAECYHDLKNMPVGFIKNVIKKVL